MFVQAVSEDTIAHSGRFVVRGGDMAFYVLTIAGTNYRNLENSDSSGLDMLPWLTVHNLKSCNILFFWYNPASDRGQ